MSGGKNTDGATVQVVPGVRLSGCGAGSSPLRMRDNVGTPATADLDMRLVGHGLAFVWTFECGNNS
ncbi:hypothetical protein STA1M1_31300 [Sinisalibacter aestuarii]|uniref:Uncharacterized protein n=1 Tax=Sinisalibacter aestuarii TaxID=2949426 RepID=A0ABQ5LYB9_9RHOB|nr:hypothetical protein STA1M1_31300 [Sinisalibacter aestuarii]